MKILYPTNIVVISKIPKIPFYFKEHNTMSLEQYNQFMSDMLNQQQTLAKLRAELEEKEKRKCFSCRKFRYLACNCRNSIGEEERKIIPKISLKYW